MLVVFFLAAAVARSLCPLVRLVALRSGRPVAMGGGNGAKSKTKRERNATKTAKTGNTSQLGANLKAMSILCTVCKQVCFWVLFARVVCGADYAFCAHLCLVCVGLGISRLPAFCSW